MKSEEFTNRKKMLVLREELVSVEEARMNGEIGYSVDNVALAMKAAILEIAGE